MSSESIYSSPKCCCIVCRKETSSKGINTHFKHNHDHEWRSQWDELNSKSLPCAVEKSSKLYEAVVENYNNSPTKCQLCSAPLEYKKRNNKFCSRSCSASSSNSKRTHTTLSKDKISNTLKGTRTGPRTTPHVQKICKVQFKTCTCCGCVFYTKTWCNQRKTCSRECQTHMSVGNRPYKNGRRKLFEYFNKCEGKIVLLESSWELCLAEWLDANDIEWIRPTFIRWYDPLSNKSRLYYPDFYLTTLGFYLDPKNPYAMDHDKHKMSIVSTLIDIVYGDIEYVKKPLCLSGWIRTSDVISHSCSQSRRHEPD